MDLRVDFKNPTKDSNSDIVTLECHISAYWANGDKVYDESFLGIHHSIKECHLVDFHYQMYHQEDR